MTDTPEDVDGPEYPQMHLTASVIDELRRMYPALRKDPMRIRAAVDDAIRYYDLLDRQAEGVQTTELHVHVHEHSADGNTEVSSEEAEARVPISLPSNLSVEIPRSDARPTTDIENAVDGEQEVKRAKLNGETVAKLRAMYPAQTALSHRVMRALDDAITWYRFREMEATHGVDSFPDE